MVNANPVQTAEKYFTMSSLTTRSDQHSAYIHFLVAILTFDLRQAQAQRSMPASIRSLDRRVLLRECSRESIDAVRDTLEVVLGLRRDLIGDGVVVLVRPLDLELVTSQHHPHLSRYILLAAAYCAELHLSIQSEHILGGVAREATKGRYEVQELVDVVPECTISIH